MKRELSVLIPARNEDFLNQTIDNVLANLRADTEIIVVLDGCWPPAPLPTHPRLTVIRRPTPIGQRAATNEAARVSDAEFVMKLDAHCAVAEGFDVALIAAARELGPDVTQIARMYNLHGFDWQCLACGHRTYQGPKPTACANCKAPGDQIEQAIVWQPRWSRCSDFMRFDATLHFQYWGEFKTRPEAQSDLAPLLSSVGAMFFMGRERFWSLGGLDEAHGSWGQFGVEVSLKSWLSGGRQVVNKRTWFAHMFRTQNGFGFPYPLSQRAIDQARTHSRALWMQGKWAPAVKPLRALIDQFWPIPGWTEDDRAALPSTLTPAPPTKGLVYYSDGRPDAWLLNACRRQLRSTGLPLVEVTCDNAVLPPIEDDDRVRKIALPDHRGYLTMFRQILAGLEALDTEYAFLVEHDVLYHPSHFAFTPPTRDTYFYNVNVWKVDAATGRAVTYLTKQTSGLCADRHLLIAHYRKRIALVEAAGFSRAMGFEPGSHGRAERVDDIGSDVWRSAGPNVDIRHDKNLTASRWSPAEFRSQRNCRDWTESDRIPEWGITKDRFVEWLTEVVR